MENRNRQLPAEIKKELFPEDLKNDKDLRSYLPSALITAALPLRDTKNPLFVRKYNNIKLSMTGAPKVPYGNYGRLVLSILTTHAVLSQEGDLMIRYESNKDLTDELLLDKQRGKNVLEQLELFSKATFNFEEKKKKKLQGNLFGDESDAEYEQIEYTTGKLSFIKALRLTTVKKTGEKQKNTSIDIILDQDFTSYCKEHAVPIDYTVFSKISSPLGKDLYAWIVYRNNSLGEDSLYITKEMLVNQFMPVSEDKDREERSHQMRTNYNLIVERIEEIKKKYYPGLRIFFDAGGMTFEKSPAVIQSKDTRYMLVTDK